MTRRPPRSAQERANIDRADLFLQAEIDSDPVKALRERLTKMLVMEQRINDDLYAAEVVDQSALSASNKRIIELGQALKALPSQSAGENKGNQRSTAELILDQLSKPADQAALQETAEVQQGMLKRAADAFGEGK